jgi:hypothetical protein
MTLGISRDNLTWIACGLGLTSLALLGFGAGLVMRRDKSLPARLEEMESEYAELVERNERRHQ